MLKLLKFHPKPVIYGMLGTELSQQEQQFFKNAQPLGFILFARNIASRQQIIELTQHLQQFSPLNPALILIDQEGGRVQRIKAPIMPNFPPAKAFGDIYANNKQDAITALACSTQLLATHLRTVGITANCAPVCDISTAATHKVIGDRAFSHNPTHVAQLAQIQAENLITCHIAPIIKHIPGHGRAKADSHETLPTVNTNKQTLQNTDFIPFKALASQPILAPFAMTAHILYKALDDENPATLSPNIIAQTIRSHIGFNGLLMTDDLSMHALSGDFSQRTNNAIKAGCDIILHCNGNIKEMQEINSALTPMPQKSLDSWQKYHKSLHSTGESEQANLNSNLEKLTSQWQHICSNTPNLKGQ